MLSIGLFDSLLLPLGVVFLVWFFTKISAIEGHLDRLVKQGERREIADRNGPKS